MAIASVVQRGSYVYVYDEKSRQLSVISCGGRGDELRGYTASTVSIRKGSYIYIYNEKGQQISCHHDDIIQERVDCAVLGFVKKFTEYPFLHRCEHSLHIALYNELTGYFPGTFVFGKDLTCYVHKEFPGRPKNPSQNNKLVDRTNVDIAVLKQKQIDKDDFIEGNTDIDFALELSLEYGIEHLCWDLFKYVTGSNRSAGDNNYIIHLYNRNHDGFDKNKIDDFQIWKDGELQPKVLNEKVEWCYYLVKLCIKFSEDKNNDDYDKINKILKHFVCEKSTTISDGNYSEYLPDDEDMQRVLQKMRFVLVDANNKTIRLTNIPIVSTLFSHYCWCVNF